MKLSVVERKGIRVEAVGSPLGKMANPQVVGKVMAEKLVNAEGLSHALGRIWCPIKGVIFKDLGENRFLFTFLQSSGKRKALEDGLWMFGKDLVVVMDLDESKSIEEMEFVTIPIWVRVMKLPFGMMNKAAGEVIGGEIGSFICMDHDEDGTTIGCYLHIKVKLDIRKPLMRGVTIQLDEKGEKTTWCPLKYEFLPDFCYTCGIIGHIDRLCDIKLAEGEVQQYSKLLRCIPSKGKGGEGRSWSAGGSWSGGGCQFSGWNFGGGSNSRSRGSSGRLTSGGGK
jgi:uncharacterized membrane protein YgcG